MSKSADECLIARRLRVRAFVVASACVVFSACGARTSLGLGNTDGSSPALSDGGDPLAGLSIVLFGGVGDSATPLRDTWTWHAGGRWTLEHPLNAPPANIGIVGTSLSDGFLLFTGAADGSRGTTWLWNAANWTQLNPTQQPQSRTGATLVPIATGAMLYGGWGNPNPSLVESTWTWNGVQWTNVPLPSTYPTAWYGASAVPLNGTVFRFGGVNNAFAITNETWVHETTWRRVAPLHAPTPRNHASMFTCNGVVYLFGGQTINGPIGDMWTWNGSDWTELHPSPSPSARAGAAVASHAAMGVLFGGGANSKLLSDMWTWDGTRWTEQTGTGPSARIGAVMGALRE